MKKNNSIIFSVAIALGLFLLLFKISDHSIWIDEAYTLRMISYPLAKLCGTVFSQDPHPPLYYILLKTWCGFFDVSVVCGICFSVFFAVLSVFAGSFLTYMIFGNGLGVIVPIILTSPFFIMFSRHIRYYSFVSFLVLMNIILLIKFIESKRKAWWWFLLSAHVLLLYSDYPASTIFLGEFIAVLILRRDKLKKLVFLDIIAVALFLPWLSQLFYHLHHLSSLSVEAAFSYGLNGFFVRVFFSLYDFLFGECVYPWDIHITVPLFFIYAVGFIRFVKIFPSFSKRQKQISLFVIIMIGVSFFSGVFMANRFVGKQSFVYMPSRMMFCFIPFMIICSRGIFSLKKYRYLLVAAVVILNLVVLKNYYTGKNYINPLFAVDWQNAVNYTKTEYRYGDIVISDNTEVLSYYADTVLKDALFFENQDKLKSYLLSNKFENEIRFFLMSTKRDSTQSGYFDEDFINHLINVSKLLNRKDYGAVSERYYNLKKRFTGKAYRYKMSLYLLKTDPNALLEYFEED